MDIWQRFERLVRSWVEVPEDHDQEWHEAWDEIEEFLRRDNSNRRGPEAGVGAGGLPPTIREALADLELEPGATMGAIRSAYRRLLVQYHPDQHAQDAERYQTATEVTRRLTLAYQRLQAYYG